MAIQDRSIKILGSSNSYIDLGPVNGLTDKENGWTIEGWTKLTNSEASGFVFGMIRTERNSDSIWVTFEDNQFQVHLGNANKGVVSTYRTEYNFAFNTWHHLMMEVAKPRQPNGRNANFVRYEGDGNFFFRQTNVREWTEFKEGQANPLAIYHEQRRDDWTVYLRQVDGPNKELNLHRKKVIVNGQDILNISEFSAPDVELRLYLNGQELLVFSHFKNLILDPKGKFMLGGINPAATQFQREIKGNNVKLVRYSGQEEGSFRQVSPMEWVEYKAGSGNIFATYKESSRDEWSTFIEKEDGTSIQIDLLSRKVLIKGNPTFDILESSDSSGSFVNGFNAQYVEYTRGEESGAFIQTTSNEWIKQQDDRTGEQVEEENNQNNSYKELFRDEWSIYLERNEDGADIQIDLHDKDVKLNRREVLFSVVDAKEYAILEMDTPSLDGLCLRDVRLWNNSVEGANLWDPYKTDKFPIDFLQRYYPFNSTNFQSIQYPLDFPIAPTTRIQNVTWEVSNDYPITNMLHNVAACEFSGNGNDFIEIQQNTSFKLQNAMTIEGWIKIPEKQQETSIISCVEDKGGWQINIIRHRLEIIITQEESSSKERRIRVPNRLKPNIWYHIAFAYDGERGHIFINSKLHGRHRVDQKDFLSPEAPLFFGDNPKLPDFRRFQGVLAEVRLWNVALSDQAIQQIMFTAITNEEVNLLDQSGRPVEIDKLVGYWKLDATYSEEALDSSSLRNSGKANKVFRTLTHLPLSGRKLFSEEERRLNVRKFWEGGTVSDISTIQSLRNDIKKLERLNRAYSQSIDKLEVERTALLAKVEELETKLSESSIDGATLSSIIQNANKEIQKARTALQSSDYKLGTVNIDLMVIPAGDGEKFILPKFENQIPTGEQLSKLELEFSPKDSGVKEPEEVIVPDLSGLTEVMAYRKLSNVGLVPDLKFQAVSEPKFHDRVVRQIPKVGTALKINSAVLIFVGKES